MSMMGTPIILNMIALSHINYYFRLRYPIGLLPILRQIPSQSFAVTWRTNQQIDSGFVEIARATDGPEFLRREVRKIPARSARFENQNRREPLVKATYHSALVLNLEPNTTYVYRVGDGSADDVYWSEWYQLTTANNSNNATFSFIYFGDAQNNVKSMWSRVYQKLVSAVSRGRFYVACRRLDQ